VLEGTVENVLDCNAERQGDSPRHGGVSVGNPEVDARRSDLLHRPIGILHLERVVHADHIPLARGVPDTEHSSTHQPSHRRKIGQRTPTGPKWEEGDSNVDKSGNISSENRTPTRNACHECGARVSKMIVLARSSGDGNTYQNLGLFWNSVQVASMKVVAPSAFFSPNSPSL
jgi:hypothetical protein